MIRKIRNREKGVSLTEYGIIISLLSATLWAVFATWEIWGWGEDINTARTRGEGRATLAADLGVDELYEDSDDGSDVTVTTTVEAPTTTVATTTVPPEVTNDNGELTLTGADGTTGTIDVRYMGANAGLAPYSSFWMRVVNADGTVHDVQLTTDNTGDARDVVSDYQLEVGDQISFFLRVKPRAWSTSYYDWCNARGLLTGTGNSAYYDMFSTNSSQTVVTEYAEGSLGNIFGTDEFHVGFEDLFQAYSGCDDDFNDAEFRVAVDWDESDLLI